MAEIVKDGNGAKLVFSNLARPAVKLASVGSTRAAKKIVFSAEVIPTSARMRSF
jgi:hypothetical protein